MNPSKLFLTLGVAAALSFRADAAISVTGAGSAIETFDALPPAGSWSTRSIAGGNADINTLAEMETAVQAVAGTAFTATLTTDATAVPGASGTTGRWNSDPGGLHAYTRPTANAATQIRALLQNDTSGTITSCRVTFDRTANAMITEQVDGHQVFISASGTVGSWVHVPSLSGGAAGNVTAVISPGGWVASGTLFVVFVDDNANPGTDGSYTIDNFVISEVTSVFEPTTITITSPTGGQTVAVCCDLTVDTTTTGPITNVDFLVDGAFVTNDTSFAFGGIFMVPAATPLGSHSLTAVATDNTGATVTSAAVMFTVIANTPPTLTITNTFSGTVTGLTFLVGSPITVQAGFSDDDVITNISWFVDNVLYITNRINGTWTYVNSLAGTHVLKGEAADRKGTITTATRTITITNPPAAYTRLLTNGSEWRYFVTSTAEPPVQGVEPWHGVFYDDTGIDWASGFAELGNGDVVDGHPERTMIDIGPAGTRYSAMYFRKTFDVSNPSLFPTLVVRLLRDDGAVVYINGAPIWTNNMTPSAFPVPYGDFAAASDDGLNYQVLNLPNPSDALVVVAGQNTVAVEVHQQNAGSSDLSFDLMIWGTSILNMPPSVTLTNPLAGSNLMVGTFVAVAATASDTDGTVAAVEFYDNGILRSTDTTAPYGFTLSDLTAGAHTLRAVAIDNSGSNSTPASVMIVVTNPPALTAVLTNGSDWKYLDSGVDQLTAWTALGFDDMTWSNGIAELGYGDLAGETRPERTVVSFGPDATNKFVTTYFRKKITKLVRPDTPGRVARRRHRRPHQRHGSVSEQLPEYHHSNPVRRPRGRGHRGCRRGDVHLHQHCLLSAGCGHEHHRRRDPSGGY